MDDGWVKSDFCDAGACVEVKYMPDGGFVRSSFCEGGACIEVGYQSSFPHVAGTWHAGEPVMTQNPDGSVTIGSTTDPATVTFTGQEWAAFVKGADAGQFSVERLHQLGQQ